MSDRGPAARHGPITAATRLVCLLGHPVAHSRSPQMHNAAFAAAGVDAVYLAMDVAPDRLPRAVEGLRALGFLGANVTVPHKQAVLGLVDERTAEAEAVGAANTLYWEGDRLVADNTDAAGLQDVLQRDLRLEPGTPVVLFGAGGAARAAAVALGRLHARVRVDARRPEAAAEVARLAERHGATIDEHAAPAMVINATPLGLYGEALPNRHMRLKSDQVAFDLLYGPQKTPFLAAASARGALTVDGAGMLVAQAARSFERWTRQEAPAAVMAAAVRC